ncbi:hypothetical protein KAFR_0D00390 [Kazachstania africana CBS 2517]|uniref:Ras-associating domain-containing protein n=1 Tax=Kazachstania africana (strain ATCC 22294 / BCRC 22015 / CBS 2517 / CECT 1963 / NBRC 1671 / NRRL Y-8276) TaxID=1071382 RepID=H2ATI6_KAZAF|nr:hypothetical protein KAFR_0D00390 [Kazachstania africana CBS 2517]CCF57686.1 hypothetical protein KAFR_0D00390 [Kazachstania africana CBS 2517]
MSESPVSQINNGDYANWTVDEVVSWCKSTLKLPDDNSLCLSLVENDVSGSILKDLTLDDCKDLCDSNLKLAIKLKISINKLNDTSADLASEQNENINVLLKNLYTTLSHKLQEYESQYKKLRMDVLEVMKTSPSPIQHTQGDYFEQKRAHTPATHIGTATAVVKSLPDSSKSASVVATNEPLKQLRASKEDSCERVLKNAMKRHNLNDQDWKQYVLVLCYADQERILELHEKPVIIFKNLKQQGLHPSIMLRRKGDFEEVPMSNLNNHSSNDNGNLTPGGRL